MLTQAQTTMRGDLGVRVMRAPQAPLSWKIKNALRPEYLWGLFANGLAKGLTRLTGIPTITSELSVRARLLTDEQRPSYLALRDRLGQTVDPYERQLIQSKMEAIVSATPWMNYGVVGRRVVTTAGVTFMATDWKDGSTDITNFNWHSSGSGSTAEAIGDTALVAITPEGYAFGTKTTPSANVLQTVATISYTGTRAVVEHGITSGSTGGPTLWDRTVFAVINVASGDSIQYTYSCTISAGG